MYLAGSYSALQAGRYMYAASTPGMCGVALSLTVTLLAIASPIQPDGGMAHFNKQARADDMNGRSQLRNLQIAVWVPSPRRDSVLERYVQARPGRAGHCSMHFSSMAWHLREGL